jgi:hypothetical protein
MERLRTMDRKAQIALGCGGLLLSCLLIVCVAGVLAVVFGDDENPSTVAQATATPAEAAIVEPSPTPIPTQAPAEPLGETQYLQLVETTNGQMGDSVSEFVGLMEDPTFEPEWEASLRSVLGDWRRINDEITGVTPPDGLQDTHEQYVLALDNYVLAADALDEMLEDQTQESVDRAVTYMNLGNVHLNEFNNLLEAYTPSGQ